MSDIGYSWGMTGHDTNTKGTTMTIATKIQALKDFISECIDLRDCAYGNFDLTEEEVMEEVGYYNAMIAQYESERRALEVWA